jgi:tRNA-2-methylthio-N6-dimethylallyladenosine synthase
MNAYDTEVASGLLQQKGYAIYNFDDTTAPSDWREAEQLPDVVLMNTCSVREHAEDRVFGRLGMLGKAKKKRPELIVGLMGCMVEEHKEKLFKRFPQLDLMVGTRNIKDLPLLIEKVEKDRRQVAQIQQDGISIEYTDQIKREGVYHAWLPIMTGCDKKCTFCVVPITRGAEVSMKARDVYREASRLVGEGVKWITLLGQNVNSYDGSDEDRAFQPLQDIPAFEGQGGVRVSFPELLDQLCGIDGLERISFTTSHPHDATEDLFQVIRKNPKISRRFHLPLQSGSDAMLKRMKRLHTFDEYKAQISRLRELVPDIAITTDIICGFCGESEADHDANRRALEEIRYDGAFIYKYSVRPGTPAAKLPDDVPEEVKHARNLELLEIQRKITDECNQSRIGQTVTAFVEEKNPRNSAELKARSDQDKKIIFQGGDALIGTFVRVRLKELRNETFWADLI